MVKKITISNYKSIAANTTIQLENLTVFVGQNGSGKSNIVDVFSFVSDAMRLGLEGAITKRNGIQAIRRWTYSRPYNISIKLDIDEKEFYGSYSFDVSSHTRHEYIVKNEHAYIKYKNGANFDFLISEQKWISGPDSLRPAVTPQTLAFPLIGGDEKFSPLFNSLTKMRGYSIYPDTLRIPQKYDPGRPMEEHGNNWVSILKDQDDNSWKDDIIKALNKLTNEIDDIDISSVSGYLVTKFRHGNSGESNKPKWFESSQESDGTLRIAGIITALLQKPSLTVIGIEEPELTIHPGAIGLVFDFLKQASLDSQILITTHSPELLDLIKEPECVRVITKRGNATYVSKMKEDQTDIVRAGLYSLGEIHRTEGINSVSQQEFEFPA